MNSNPDSCALCGLPLRCGRFPLGGGDRRVDFCCQGCRQVFLMLSEASDAAAVADFRHTDLYRRCVEMGVIPRSEEDLASRAAGCRSALPDRAADRGDSGREGFLPLNFIIDGMWCPACAWVIEESLRKASGIGGAICNFSTDRLRCEYDPTQTAPDEIQRIVQRLGYRAREPEAPAAERQRHRRMIRFAISAFLTMNVMMLSFALYSGFFTDLEADAVWKISWPMFFLATVVMVYGGMPMHRKGLQGLLGGQPGMEALISIGALSAYSYSVVNLLQGSIHLYFDTTCMLIFLVQLGKLLERQAKDRIQEDLGHYYALMPAKVYLCSGPKAGGRYVAAHQLAPGDLFRVTEGETLAADGRVVEGTGLVDASSLTGEARAQSRTVGDRLAGGTRVIEGKFVVCAEKVGQASTLGQMLGIMDAALSRKTTAEGWTDSLLRIFVPVMIALAAATGVVLLTLGSGPEEAFLRGLTVLVITCPCALGVAVPLARVAGVSLAARKGVLVQDFAAFDTAERIDTVVFDKTGTLTQGRWQLQTVVPLADLKEDALLALAAGLEQGIDHPIAVEIRRAAATRQVEAAPVTALSPDACGVAGFWQGRPVRVGRPDGPGAAAYVPDHVGVPPPRDDAALMSQVDLVIDARVVGRLEFGDRLKPNALEAVQRLQARGLDLRLVSGDSQTAADRVGAWLNISDVRGDLSPAQKAQFIQSLRAEGRTVAMAGDGINDAPALASADLSVAIFAGRQLGEAAQAVTLMQGDPLQLVFLLAFCGRVNRKIRQNLWGSLFYNLVSIPVAMMGWLSPLVAVGAMLLSSLSVTGNTLLLIRGEKRSPRMQPALSGGGTFSRRAASRLPGPGS